MMGDKDQDTAYKIRDCLNQLVHGKVNERKKQVENLKNFLVNPSVLSHLNRSTAIRRKKEVVPANVILITWSKVFSQVKDFIEQETVKLREREDSTETPSSIVLANRKKDKSMCCDIFRCFVKSVKANEQYPLGVQIIEHVLAVMTNHFTLSSFGLEYNVVLQKEVLSEPFMCLHLSHNVFNEAIGIYCQILGNPPPSWDRSVLTLILHQLLLANCNMYDLQVPKMFSFFGKMFNSVRQEKASRHHENLLNSVLLICRSLGSGSPHQVCQLGETIIFPLIQLWYTRPAEACKNLMLEFFFLQLCLHQHQVEKEKPPWVGQDWTRWKNNLLQLYQMVMKEMNDICGKNKNKYSTSKESTLKPNFIQVAVEICAQAFRFCSNSIDVTLTQMSFSFDSSGSTKKRRIEVGFQTLVDALSSSSSSGEIVPWLQLISAFLLEYPQIAPVEQIESIFELLIQFHLTCNQLDTKNWLLHCCQAVVHAVCSGNAREESSCDWLRLWELGVRSVSLMHQCAETGHRLLTTMLFHKLVTPKTEFFNLYSPGCNNRVTSNSLHTLFVYLHKYTLPSNILNSPLHSAFKSDGAGAFNFRNQVLEWIFSRKNDDNSPFQILSADIDPSAYELLAKVLALLCVQRNESSSDIKLNFEAAAPFKWIDRIKEELSFVTFDLPFNCFEERRHDEENVVPPSGTLLQPLWSKSLEFFLSATGYLVEEQQLCNTEQTGLSAFVKHASLVFEILQAFYSEGFIKKEELPSHQLTAILRKALSSAADIEKNKGGMKPENITQLNDFILHILDYQKSGPQNDLLKTLVVDSIPPFFLNFQLNLCLEVADEMSVSSPALSNNSSNDFMDFDEFNTTSGPSTSSRNTKPLSGRKNRYATVVQEPPLHEELVEPFELVSEIKDSVQLMNNKSLPEQLQIQLHCLHAIGQLCAFMSSNKDSNKGLEHFPGKAVSSFIIFSKAKRKNIKKAADIHLLIAMSKCILLNKVLEPLIVGEVIKTIKEILNRFGKLQDVCVASIELFPLIYPHVFLNEEESSSTDTLSNKEHLLHLHHVFWKKENEGKAMCETSFALVKSMLTLIQMAPAVRWKNSSDMNEDNILLYESFASLMKSNCHLVRHFVSSHMDQIFTFCPTVTSQCEMFQSLYAECVSALESKGDDAENRTDEKFSRLSALLHFVGDSILNIPVCEKEAIFLTCQLVQEKKSTQFQAVKVLSRISTSLGYKTLKDFVEPRLSYVIYKWLSLKFPVKDFPFMVLELESKEEFIVKYYREFVPPLFYSCDLDAINAVSHDLELSVSDVIYSCLPAIQSQIICWFSADANDSRAHKCKELLESLVPLQVIEATFHSKLDQIVIHLLTMLKGKSEEDIIARNSEKLIDLSSLSQEEFYSTLNYVLSKTDCEGSFVSFLCLKEDNVQNVLLYLSVNLSKAKRHHEQRRVVEMYRLVVELLLPEFQKCLQNGCTFIVRDVIYSIIHFLVDDKNHKVCNEQNFVSCIEILQVLCEKAIEYFPEDIGVILPFIVSSLTPFVEDNASAQAVLSLFSLLVIQSEDCLSNYVSCLDPFPQNQLFSNLNQRQKQLVYQNKKLTLQQDMQYFLTSLMMTGKGTTDGLKHLYLQLNSKHSEMLQLLKGFQESVLFCEDVKSSTFHQLICKLTHLCTPGVATQEVQIEASRCLGTIGAVAFSTTVLQPSSFAKSDETTGDNLFQSYEFILKLLRNYLIDQRIDIKVTTSEVLKSVFSTKMAQNFITALKSRKMKDTLLRHIYPFVACHKNNKPKTACAFEVNVEKISDDALWLPGQSSHSEWITNLVCAILESGITSCNFFESLLPLCRKEPSFCEKILPYTIHVILLQKNNDVQEALSSGVSLFFSSLSNWLETNSAGKSTPSSGTIAAAGSHFDRASVQTMLSVVYHLWLHPKKEAKETGNVVQDFWLSLNYLQVAQAAQFCSAYFTAILYTEMWCDISREKKRSADFSNEMREDYSSQSSSPLSMSSQDREKATLVYDIFLNAYSSIGDLDAVYGCEEIATDSQSIVRHSYLIEKKWGELLRLYDMDNSSMGILQTLQMCGLNNVLQGFLPSLLSGSGKASTPEVVDYQYQCAWRMNQWNMPLTEMENPGFYENLYKSQQCLKTVNEIGFKKNLELARSKQFEALSHISLESTRNVLPVLCNLQMLSTLEDFSDAQCSPDALHKLIESWDLQDRFPYEDFEFVEPVMWLRSMLLKQRMETDFSPHAMFPKLSKFLERYIEISRREFSLETASSGLQALRSLSCAGEEDHLRWEMEDSKILWTKKEHSVAIKVLRSLLHAVHKHVEEGPGFVKIYGEALTLAGRWLAETCSENSTIIMQEYLEKAVSVLDQVSSEECASEEDTIWNAYLAVARYADAQYQGIVDYKKSTAYQTKQELMQHSRVEVDKLDKKDLSDDGKKTRIILVKQLNIDDEELKNLDLDQQQFLIKAITNYLKCLRGTDTHDLWIFRLISLWFANLANAEVNSLINNHIETLDTYKFLPIMYQLAARMGAQAHPQFSKNLSQLIMRIATDHPHHALPIILALGNADKDPVDNKKSSKKAAAQHSDVPAIKERMQAADKILSKLQHTQVNAVLRDTSVLCDAYISLAYLSADDLIAKKQRKGKIPDDEQIRKLKNLSNIPIITENLKVDRSCKYSDIVGIHSFSPEYSLIGGITVPKVIKCKGMDGREREQLVKGRDDLRQDAVMQQVFSLVNNLLSQKIETKRRKLCIRTYKVVPVSRRSGVIQWCEGTQVISQYLVGPVPKGGAHHRYYPNMATHLDSQKKMKTIANFSFLPKKREVFDAICKNFPPVFRYFFVENFPEPCAWFERRQSYTKSVAASSIVGYILGLGDRHVNNILVDKNTAEVVHIDFGIAFEKGHILATPETVPFRLTRDIVDGMGINGVEGTFKRCCEKTMEVLRDSQDVLLTILEVLLYDPLYDWTVPPSKTQHRNQPANHQEVNKLAERALMRLQKKLHGLEEGVALSVSGQVNLLIQQARDPNNLCRLYAGWQPYL